MQSAHAAGLAAMWQVQLLGGLCAQHGDVVLAQFPSRPIAALLARLALDPQRRHSREELIELLWPEVTLEVGRNRLRKVLSTLRRLLEPLEVGPGSVLIADRQSIGLHSHAISCDVQEFERQLREGSVAQALLCYRGELLPGFFDEWVEDARARLRALFEMA
jgi:DNA-binding SARP family transcriptional activator